MAFSVQGFQRSTIHRRMAEIKKEIELADNADASKESCFGILRRVGHVGYLAMADGAV
jgi:hypothetical protein